MGYHHPVCHECQISMYCEKQGIYIVDNVNGKPNLITSSDLWQCPICEKQAVTGFANSGVSNNDLRFKSTLGFVMQHTVIQVDHENVGFNRDSTYRPVCGTCSRDMHIKSSGAYGIDMFSDPPRPYKITGCTLYECPECNRITAESFADSSLYHHQDGFDSTLDSILLENVYVVTYEHKQDAIDKVNWRIE